jgi:hypothetical protein
MVQMDFFQIEIIGVYVDVDLCGLAAFNIQFVFCQ